MKKTIFFIAICLSLVLLLGAIGPRPHTYDPNSECHEPQQAFSRKRILDYEIITADNPIKLKEEVNERLKDKEDKWIPLGGISLDSCKYCQAMVKVTQ